MPDIALDDAASYRRESEFSRRPQRRPDRRRLHRYAIFAAAATLPLVFVGGAVTSKNAGLAVPDWPLSYGYVMPPRWMEIDHIRVEHGHRILGAAVGLLVVVMTIWIWRREHSRSLRWFAAALLAGVCVQGLLGGLRVLLLSTPFAIVHGCLAQLFFSAMVVMAVVTSPGWRDPRKRIQLAHTAEPGMAEQPLPGTKTAPRSGRSPQEKGFESETRTSRTSRSGGSAFALPVAVFAQLVLGAITRHTGMTVLPHVIWAGVVAGLVYFVAGRLLREARQSPLVHRVAMILAVLVSLQLGLGLGSWLVVRQMNDDATATLLEWGLPTAHVAVGALLLAASVVLAVSQYRVKEVSASCRG